jgi:hypothetical protein
MINKHGVQPMLYTKKIRNFGRRIVQVIVFHKFIILNSWRENLFLLELLEIPWKLASDFFTYASLPSLMVSGANDVMNATSINPY